MALCPSSTVPEERRVPTRRRGRAVGHYEHSERGGAVYADLFRREPGVSPEHAAEASWPTCAGMRIAGDEALGLALLAAGRARASGMRT